MFKFTININIYTLLIFAYINYNFNITNYYTHYKILKLIATLKQLKNSNY